MTQGGAERTTEESQEEKIIKATQDVLPDLCQRRILSSTGSEAVLASRLIAYGFETIDDLKNLANQFKNEGVDKLVWTSMREKSPNWTKHEIARICLVISNPAHGDTLALVYTKCSSNVEIESCLHGPWVNKLVDMFNDLSFHTHRSDFHDSVRPDLLMQFDPKIHPTNGQSG